MEKMRILHLPLIAKWYDMIERGEKLEEYREDPPATPPPPLQYTVEEIKGALLLLPDNYRTILSLHLFEGYDYQEIEQITGTKEATLRSLYKRAKEKLAAQLQQNRK